MCCVLFEWCNHHNKHRPFSELDLNVLRALSLVMSGLVLQSKLNLTHVLEEKEKLFLKWAQPFFDLFYS